MNRSNLMALGSILFALVANQAFAASPVCNSAANENRLVWPATGTPVWEMCWVPVPNSSGPRGSGLELRNIHFRGVLVIKRAHSPNLFAEYKGGAGGDCYRDWKDSGSAILIEPVARNTLGTPVNFTATTSCDVSSLPTQSYGSCPFLQPGRTAADCGTANTIAIENLTNNAGMRLTAQYTAGWYKYTARFIFAPDGTISPEFGFGNSDGTYNGTTHWHHNYWRFDFDIDGASNDQIIFDGSARTTEFAAVRANRSNYQVIDAIDGFGYEIVPGSNDNTYPANESGRGFHTVDVIGTLYKATEYSDRPTWNLNDCAMTASSLANGENIDQKDVVLYYRASVRDTTANDWPVGGPFIPQDSMVCKRVGPQLRLIGNFPIPEGDFLIFRDGAE